MLTLALSLALAQLTVQEEGVNLGSAWVINCSGSGITCTRNAVTRTVTMAVSSSGGGDGGGIPDTIPVITYSASADLSAERVLSTGNYTTIDLGTAAQAQVDWAHGLTCNSGQALTSSGTTAMVCTSTLTASDLVCAGACVGDAEIAAVSGAKVSGAVASATTASTATALVSNPTDCSPGQYATTIDTGANLTCAQVAYSQVSGTPVLYNQMIQDEGGALTQRASLNFAGSGVSCVDDTTRTTCTVSSGSANVVEATVDFGAAGDTTASVVVTGQAWVTASSKIICAPTLLATTDRSEGMEDAVLEELVVAAHTRSAGVGFIITAGSAQGRAIGKFLIHCTGA